MIIYHKKVVDNARALGEYAVLYKSIFEGTSYFNGEPFSAEVIDVSLFCHRLLLVKTGPINNSLLQPTNTTSKLGFKSRSI